MKIIAVIRNYGPDHPDSVFGDGPDPFWYEIPDSSLLRSGQPFFVPSFSKKFRIFPGIVWRISRLGKGINPEYSDRYSREVSLGCVAVGTELLHSLRNAGLPWMPAVAFDKCCMIGKFTPADTLDSTAEWVVSVGDTSLTYRYDQIRNNFGKILQMISRNITVKEGDLIFAGLHPLGLEVHAPDRIARNYSDLKVYNGKEIILDIHIR